MKKTIIVILILLVALAVIYILKQKEIKPISSGKTGIVASFYPLYFFSSQIGGEAVEVLNVTPAGAEPHDYEPSTSDISAIENSKLLVLNGVSFEPWGEKVKFLVKNKNVNVLEVAEGLADKEIVEEGEKIQDPHIWLDPVLAKEVSDKILVELIKIDPQNKNYYEAQSKKLDSEFDKLDSEFKNGLKNCSTRDIITSHAAFGYLASRYNLKQVAISGLSPEIEPSARDIAEVSKFAKENNIKYIFFETLLSPKLAETIANEIGAQTLVFNPIEGLTSEEQNEGEDYFSIQRENLKNLKIALSCQ